MNAQLQESLAIILSNAIQTIDSGVKFLSEQLPDVINQLLLWKLLAYSVPMLLSIVFFAFSIVFCWGVLRSFTSDPYRKAAAELETSTKLWMVAPCGEASIKARELMKEKEKEKSLLEDSAPAYIVLCSLAGLSFIFSTTALFVNSNLTWLQILVAPKIYLIEYASTLVK